MHKLPHYQHPSSELYICYNWWAYIDTYNYPKFIIYIMVHSLWCVFYGFGMYWNVYWNVSIMMVSNRVFSLPEMFSVLHQWSFCCLHSFAFSRKSFSWNHIVCSLFRLPSYILKKAFNFKIVFEYSNKPKTLNLILEFKGQKRPVTGGYLHLPHWAWATSTKTAGQY